jgi:creatinine amidohydrolase
MTHELALLTSKEVARYLDSANSILIPIGSYEQHGPLGLIATDILCAKAICDEASRLTGTLVGPALPLGMALHHMAFPGTLTLRPTTLIALVCDIAMSLSEHGFRRILFVNGHGGNTASIQAGFYEFYSMHRARAADAAKTDTRCALANWWELPSAAQLSHETFAEREGTHATPGEISVTWTLYPHLRKSMTLAPAPEIGGFYGPEDFKRRFPDGRIGADSSLASIEHGAALIAAAGRDVADLIGKLAREP